MEDGRGIRPLDVLEEGEVDRAGRVVEGEEDDPAAGADRWGLGGDLDPGHEHLATTAAGQQVAGPGHPERVEHRGVEVDDVPARVEAEHLELGPDPFGAGHLGQAARRGQARSVAEVEGELGGHGSCDGSRPLGLGSGEGADAPVGRDRGDPAAAPAARRGDPTTRASLGARPAVELGDMEEQVASGDPATTAEAAA